MIALHPFALRCAALTRRTTKRLLGAAGALRADRGGNVAIIFGLALIPIFGAVGVAVDYSRANAARTAMQAALDATALMISKEALNLKNTTQVQNKAQKYFNSEFKRPEVKSLVTTFTMQNNGPGDFTIIAEATGTLDTAIAGVIGKKTMDIRATSQVRWGFKALEVALALDNTGSMSSKNKMVELKAAVKLLFSILKKNSKVPDDTKIAVIPFNTVVNVGTEYADASWIAYDSKITKTTWTGCVADRDQPNDVKDAAPSGGATLFPVADCAGLAKALPLTSDWLALENMVDGMNPAGMTNVTIGLAWGWHALTQSDPFPQAQAVKNDVEKVVILLTDGLNTANRFTTNAAQIDKRTATICDNVKKAKIRVFTVRVIEGNLDLLQACATAPNMFYDVQVASQLKDVFSSIAASLSASRLSK